MPIRNPKPHSNLTNEELLTLYYAGDDEAFTEFDNRHRSPLIRQAFRRLSSYLGGRWETANDLVSDTLVNVVRTKGRSANRWNPDRGPVVPWLQKMLLNRVISFQRSPKNKQVLDSDLRSVSADGQRVGIWNLLSKDASPDTGNLEEAEIIQRLQPAIEKLPPQQQHIIHLKYWHDLTHAQIGAQVGLSPATVSRRLSAARKSLRRALAPFDLSA